MGSDSQTIEFSENGAVGNTPPSAKTPVLRPLNNLWPFLNWTTNFYLLYSIALIPIPFFIDQVTVWMMESGLSTDAVNSVILFSLVISAVGGLVSILFFIAYCRFMHRAMSNVHVVMGSEGLVSPPGSWAWHFVPIANLYMPYRAGREIWFHSRAHVGMTPEIPISANIWWIGWVGSLVFSLIAAFLSIDVAGLTSAAVDEGVTTANLAQSVGAFLAVVGTMAFQKFASRINVAQLNFDEVGLAKVFS